MAGPRRGRWRGRSATASPSSAPSIPAPADGAPAGTGTLVLLGPDGPALLGGLRGEPRAARRRRPTRSTAGRCGSIGALAAGLGGAGALSLRRPALARRSPAGRGGAARPGRRPSGLLVHARLGLFVSYRGALALPRAARPARRPPAALRRLRRALPRRLPGRARSAGGGYDVAACHGFLDTAPGRRLPRPRLRRAAGLPGGPGRCAPTRNPPSTWQPFMAGRGHATPDPHAPRQVELGRSRPARPRPPAQQARPARGRR